ncbi:DUF3592 domain-containing protein [Legionella hackeliae]|uniref:DUF3592 domain-containing protein n=1 Tax=Legionella hackeliae TaxID=449 RepID=A0A0A8UQM3_LEGHA|nr:DUF3592 domain-containing protein [Legionella hackeliae]KTD13554.1 hypothetical protein Lhac_0938 [Legionella hackeliae]CEK09402.1 conserved protein of unknown function [Legionella hackeliae]STX49310.1 Protein of uncharacterised function (DUF3592) [Legionella hackeliae]
MTHWITWRWLLDLLWLAFLLALLLHFWQDRKNFLKIQSWFLTKGRITQFLWTQEGYRLWPKIEYSYRVLDQDFQGERLFPETMHINLNSKYAREVAYRAALAYEKDVDIDIYYNPYNPQEAVLDITMPRKLTLIIILLTALILFHLVIVAYRLL